MSKDEIALAALVIAFAAFVTSHVALCLGISARTPRVRGLVALVVAPLAPFWGARDRLWVRVTLWVFFAVTYAALRMLAAR